MKYICDVEKEPALLSTSYFPSVSYVAALKLFDCKIELYENYQKRSIRNKCKILGANGTLQLSVPLKKGKTQVPITQVEIDYSEDWVINHIRSIRSAYGTSAYFEFYFDKVCDILNARPSKLHLLNHSILEWLQKTGLIENFSYTQAFIHPKSCPMLDLRYDKFIGIELPAYDQVFSDKYGFVTDLSILDLIFNLGPEANLSYRDIKYNLEK
ncbi:MAG: hypothetical protein HKN09_09965 [Saprospiraceae bacterium]|nr:hypothetical protein [Saprospiraceae bacterium]